MTGSASESPCDIVKEHNDIPGDTCCSSSNTTSDGNSGYCTTSTMSSSSTSSNSPTTSADDQLPPPLAQDSYDSAENKDADIVAEISALVMAVTAVVQEQNQQGLPLANTAATQSPLISSASTLSTPPEGQNDEALAIMLQSTAIITSSCSSTTNDRNNMVQQNVIGKTKKHPRQPSMRNLTYKDDNNTKDVSKNVSNGNDNIMTVDDEVPRHVHKKHRRQPSMRILPLIHNHDENEEKDAVAAAIFEDGDDEHVTYNYKKVRHRRVSKKKHRRQPSMRNLPLIQNPRDDGKDEDDAAIFEDDEEEEDDGDGDDDDDCPDDCRGDGGCVVIRRRDFFANMASSDGKEAKYTKKKNKKKTIPNFICWKRYQLTLVAPNTSSSLQVQPSVMLSLPSYSSNNNLEGRRLFDGRSLSSSSSSITTTATPQAVRPPENPSTMMTSNSNNSDDDRSPCWIVGIVDSNREACLGIAGVVDREDGHAKNSANYNNLEFWIMNQDPATLTIPLCLKGPEMIRQVKSMDESASRQNSHRSSNDKRFMVYVPSALCFVMQDADEVVRAIEDEMAAAAQQRQEAPKSRYDGGGAASRRSRRGQILQKLKKLGRALVGESKSKEGQQRSSVQSANRRQRVWASAAARAQVAEGDSELCLPLYL
jgi:hypothetical protein